MHDWTGIKANDVAGRLAEIVKRRITYPGNLAEPDAGFHWVIANYSETTLEDGERVFHGILVKIRDLAIEDVFNESEWKVEAQGPLENAAEEQIPFSFFAHPHLLVHAITPTLGQERFIHLMRAFLQYKTDLSAPALNPLTERGNFLEKVRSLTKVTDVRIRGLEKSNPEYDDELAGAEEFLDRLGADKLDAHLQSKKGEIRVEKGSLPSNMLALSARGYGEAEVMGTRGSSDEIVRFSTASDALTRQVRYRSVKDLWARFSELVKSVAGADDAPVDHRTKERRRRGT